MSSLLLVDEGETEGTIESYALVSRHPSVANSRWFEDVVGRLIAAASAEARYRAAYPPLNARTVSIIALYWGKQTSPAPRM